MTIKNSDRSGRRLCESITCAEDGKAIEMELPKHYGAQKVLGELQKYLVLLLSDFNVP